MPASVAPSIPGFRPVPQTGVIYVTTRAQALGYRAGSDEWANLGQGAPETGDFPGAAPMPPPITLLADEREYAPVGGHPRLRQAVADLYNALYRHGKTSQYTAANVAISGGGRSALTRLAAAVGEVNMGHVIPDYTAYEELLNVFKAFNPIPIPLKAEEGYRLAPSALTERIEGLGLGALLLSNPSNPTGQVVQGDALRDWVEVCRRTSCACIFDEFYSHYLYGGEPGATVSAAAYVDDVDVDPVVVVDGLTKNWRFPGWRISWTVGPKSVIEAVTSAGSFLDGGASHPLQSAAADLLTPASVTQGAAALQRHFAAKRDLMISRLRGMGFTLEVEPRGGFYCWVSLESLPPSLRDCFQFFERALAEKVITVPGVFFDVNPGHRRPASRYGSHLRISFGPETAALERGLRGLERVIAAA